MRPKDVSQATFPGIHREIKEELERARTRLAVAIAAERKTMPVARWRYYAETEERMRRFLKSLRSAPFSAVGGRMRWQHVLEALRRIPDLPHHRGRHGEAHQLCRCLREVLAVLEEEGRHPCETGRA